MARRLKDGKYPIHFTKISAASRRKDCCVITPSTKYPTIRKVLDLFWFSYILWYSYIVVIFPGLLWNKVLIASQRDSLQSWDGWELKRASNYDFFAIPAYLVCLGFFFNRPVKNCARNFLSHSFLDYKLFSVIAECLHKMVKLFLNCASTYGSRFYYFLYWILLKLLESYCCSFTF